MTDQRALSRVLRQFARTMAGGYDLTEALYQLSDGLVDVLRASGAGVALLDGDDLRFVTATNDRAAAAERQQEESQSGPCVQSIRDGKPVAVADLRDRHEEFPTYAPFVEELGFRAVLGVPLVLDDRQIGSLDVYCSEPREWDEEAIDAAVVLTDIAAAYVLNARELERSRETAEQLQTALDSRVVIEQAKGVLAERLGIPADEAFERIRASARRQSRKVADVCQQVIDAGYIPD